MSHLGGTNWTEMTMRVWQLGLWCFAFAAITGCGERTKSTTATPAPGGPQEPKPPVPTATPFDETKGYLHKPSGVGFVYPDGWEKTEVRSTTGITSFGLNQAQPKATVTLYWTESDVPLAGAAAGQVEYDALKPLYGTKLGKPQPIQAGTQSGFKLAIEGAPLGQPDATLVGVVYVFGVWKDGQWWKIKFRATVTGRENLALAEQLLQNYRW